MKKFIFLLVLNAAIIFGLRYAHAVIALLIHSHDQISQVLTNVFSNTPIGNALRSLISDLTIPLIIGLVPNCFYWLFTKRSLPSFINIVWLVWLTQMGALLATTSVKIV